MAETRRTELTVMRHGETVWNKQGLQQGQLDSDLSELGVRQAGAIGEALGLSHFDALYSSDLARAVQTAEAIGQRLGLEAVTDVRLRERHLGILQGLTMAQFQRKYPEEYARFRSRDPDWVIPNGDSVRQRHERSIACANDLAERHAGRSIAVVTHGGVLEDLLRHALGLPLGAPRTFSLFNASINRFARSDGRWILDVWGDIRHLDGMGTLGDW